MQTTRFPAMVNAIQGTHYPQGSSSIAEGIAVGTPGQLTRAIIARLVDDLLLVDEGDIEQAIVMLLEVEKTLVEGAGAAGLAALLRHPQRFQGKRVGLVLCGGNIEPLLLAAIIARGMVRAGRLRASASARVTCPAHWPASPPPWPLPAPTSTRYTTSAPSRPWRRKTPRWSWSSRRAARSILPRYWRNCCRRACRPSNWPEAGRVKSVVL